MDDCLTMSYPLTQEDIDFLDAIYEDEEEQNLVRDLRQEEIEENCYQIQIKDLKTGKKILTVITDQMTIDPDFDIYTGYDTLEIKVVLSDEYVEENGDPDYMENLEEFSKKYLEE